MDLLFKADLALIPDLRHRLRQLRWFRATFRNCARTVTLRHGVRYDIDETVLAKVFLDWIEIVDSRKVYARVDRADFIIFSAGLALRELIRQGPAQARDGAAAAPEIIRFWPEGFLYTNYCICAIAALFEQEFGLAPLLDECADDLRTWWSYRENASEIPASAVAFLDRFLGAEPNWVTPDLPEERFAMRRALAATPPLDAGRVPPLAGRG